MGTSHRHTPGVTGEPNWGKASSAVTGISNAVDESIKLNDNPPTNMSPKAVAQRQSALGKRISRNYHSAVKHMISAAGGRSSVSSGTSRAIGHTGVVWAGSWTRAFQEISEQGLVSWLNSKGFHSLEGKSCHEIIGIINDFIGDYFAGLDDTAAKEALSEVMALVEEKANGNAEEFDSIFNGIVKSDEIKDLLDRFFGVYIFSHLSQNFLEKIEKSKGAEVANQTMKEIKDLILDDVQRGIDGRPAGEIDWKGDAGAQYIKDEFDRIISILEADEN